MLERAGTRRVPTLGITGTGGAGKSSLTDELVRRLRLDQDDALSIAVVSIDPSRRKSGGALLGDRIRMNAINPWSKGPRVYMRSLATREAGNELSRALPDVVAACKCAGFDLIVVETSGIGQGDAAIVPLVDASLYVMTPEYGAASQLEKIDMLDFADFVAINKFDRKGAADALRDVAKQVQRNRQAFDRAPEAMPVFGTMAARFNDDGVTALYQAVLAKLKDLGLPGRRRRGSRPSPRATAPTRCPSCRPPAPATWRRSPIRCAGTSCGPRSRRESRASGSPSRRPAACSPPSAARRTRTSLRWPPIASRSSTRARGRSSTCGRRCARPTAATSTW